MANGSGPANATPADLQAKLDNSFTCHPIKDDQESRYNALRKLGKDFAQAIHSYAPDSREKSLALTKVEEALMWANKAIAVNE